MATDDVPAGADPQPPLAPRSVLGTVAAVGFDDFPPRQWLGCFRRLGCTVCQAYRNQSGQVSLAQMQDAIAAGGLPCDSLHGVFGEQYDPSAPREPARRFAVDTYKAEGELALALGGSLVVVHCSTIRREGVPAEERARRVQQLQRSIAELGAFGESIGVRYAFENLPAYHVLGSDVGELAGWLDAVAAPHTGMCFDTGHALMTGDPAAAIRRAGRRISYVHLSDNPGQSDDHDMPTCGALDVRAVAPALHEVGYRGTLMLEVFYSVQRLERLIDEGVGDRLAEIVRIARDGPGAAGL